MKTLLLFRGAPGVGKSTFIKEHGLQEYTLSADDIRLKISSPCLMPNGECGISQKNDNFVWKLLFDFLEERMKRGEFTVIDATNSKTKEINRYKNLAKQYRYRIYIVDMTDVPIVLAKVRNEHRTPAYKIVPNEVIDNMYSRFQTQKIPSGIEVIKPNDLYKIMYKKTDFSSYKKVHIIGDIHGCATVLKEYMDKNYNENEMFVFVGDYVDRGIENAEVIEYLLSIYQNENVILLEGNHEEHLRNYASNIDNYSDEFRYNTKPALDKAIENELYTKKDIKMLCSSLGQICYFRYHDKVVLVSHGGVSNIPNNPIFVSTEQFIKGVGGYGDYLECANAFESHTDYYMYQINGHRNIENVPVHATERCFNLEGKIEFGGHLRIVTLDKDGFETFEIKNDVFKERTVEQPLNHCNPIDGLRNNSLIKEKKMGDISSFNFTRQAFNRKRWDEHTTKARGLFIDNRDDSIVARGYEKFMKVNEIEETNLENLKNTLKFPLTAYVKENGFLGMISLDKDTNDLLFATKSVIDKYATDRDLVNNFKNIFYKTTTETNRKNLREYLRVFNSTLLCECIDPINDPHIIEYKEKHIVLLDIIENTFEGKKMPYDELQAAANIFGLKCKEKACEIKDWNEFYTWHNDINDENYLYNGNHIEGFVVEDESGFMFKEKIWFYNFWKMLRGVTAEVLKKGYISNTSKLTSSEANYYYGWLKNKVDNDVDLDGKSIIELRNLFKENTCVND